MQGVIKKSSVAVVAVVLVLGASMSRAGAQGLVGPANDDLAHAQLLSYGTPASGTNLGSTREPTDPSSSCVYNQAGTVWYQLPADAGDAVTAVRISVDPGRSWTLYRRASGGALTQVSCSFASRLVTLSAAGPYYVSVSSPYSSSTGPAGDQASGSFNLLAQKVARPANDDFAAAEPLADGQTARAELSLAGVEAGEPACSTQHSVWYRFIAPSDGRGVRLSVTDGGGKLDLAAGIYSGDSVSTLAAVDCVRPGPYPSGVAAISRMHLAAGQPYYALVSGWSPNSYDETAADHTVNVALAFTTGPPNDDVAAAQPIAQIPRRGSGVGPTQYASSFAGATREVGEPTDRCTSDGAAPVATDWYTFTGPGTGTVSVTAAWSDTSPPAGTTHTAGIAYRLYRGTSPAGLTLVGCGNDQGPVPVVKGESYALQVATNDAAEGGAFTVAVGDFVDAPANDAFAAATDVALSSGTTSTLAGDNTGATLEGGEPLAGCSYSPSQPGPAEAGSVWYRFTAPGTGTVTYGLQPPPPSSSPAPSVTGTSSSPTPNVVGLYAGARVDSLAALSCAPSYTYGSTGQTVTQVTAGATYFAAVGGSPASQATGPFNLQIRFDAAPANDAFAAATPVDLGVPQPMITGDTTGSTAEAGEPAPSCSGYADAGAGTIWYRFTAPGDGAVRFGPTPVRSSSPSSNVSITASVNTTYASLYAHSDGTAGGTTVQPTVGSPPPPGPRAGDYTFGVFTGWALGALTPACAGDERDANFRSVPVAAGTTYFVAIGVRYGTIGPISLPVEFLPRPANDEFSNATPIAALSGATVTATGDTGGATAEAGELACQVYGDPQPAARSVWYTVAPPADGTLHLHLNSPRDVTVGVYSGADPAHLTTVACGDNYSYDNDFWVDLRGGTTYRIAVQTIDFVTWWGDVDPEQDTPFALDTTVTPAPANDARANAESLGQVAVVSGSNVGATSEPGDSTSVCTSWGCAGTVWYRYHATEAGAGVLHFTGSAGQMAAVVGPDGVVAPVVAPTPDAIVGAPGASTSVHAFPMAAGQDYYVAVMAPTGRERGAFDLRFAATARTDAPNANVADTRAVEHDGTADFAVSIDRQSLVPVTVHYTTSDGSAVSAGSNADFTASSGSVTFMPGDPTTKHVQVPVIDDHMDENDETFQLVLDGASGANLGSHPAGTATIVDDDAPPTVSIAGASALEGDRGTAPMLFTVSLSAPSGKTVSVRFHTADGTATGGTSARKGTDYLSVPDSASAVVTFQPGTTVATVPVWVVGDHQKESDETLSVILSAPVNAGLASGAGAVATGIIRNDDPPT